MGAVATCALPGCTNPVKQKKNRFCSRRCYGLWRRGKQFQQRTLSSDVLAELRRRPLAATARQLAERYGGKEASWQRLLARVRGRQRYLRDTTADKLETFFR